MVLICCSNEMNNYIDKDQHGYNIIYIYREREREIAVRTVGPLTKVGFLLARVPRDIQGK